MMGFLLMLQVDRRGAEHPMLPLIVLSQADCWRASVAGWGFWVGQDEAGQSEQRAVAAAGQLLLV